MTTMLNVYDRATRKKTAVLQNAFDIVETHELNQIYSLSFTLPSEDPKTQYCLPRHFVRWGDNGELYRIKAPKVNDSNTGTITYECEHAITTLCDTVMFGSFTYGGAGVRTREVINWLLNKQTVTDWQLQTCDFDRRFEYNWEQENLLNALYSIPREFADAYQWTFDTSVYPWRISLKRIDKTIKPQYYLRAKSNILSSGTSADYSNICTRLYPLGYGEGVNQLTIRSANNNVPYIQSPQEITDQYGIVEKVLVDRRFENAESLKGYAQTMLDLYQTPSMSRSFDVVDLYPLTNQSWDDAEVGKICRMTQDNTTAYITRTRRQYDKAGDLQIDLSTKASDIASNVADLADRIRIESVYAQGATQLYQHSKDANATKDKGMVVSLYFPSEMKQINKVLLRLKLNKFRSYSKTTSSNGGFKQTYTVSAAQKQITSQTNTGSSPITVTFPEQNLTTEAIPNSERNFTTTEDGGGTGQTGASTDNSSLTGSATSNEVWNYSDVPAAFTGTMTYRRDQSTGNSIRNYDESGWDYSADPDPYEGGPGHYHKYYKPYGHYHILSEIVIPSLSIDKRQFSHTHTVSLSGAGSHSHPFSLGPHSHKLSIDHIHNVKIGKVTTSVTCPSHTHNITIPGHSHTINIDSHTHDIAAGIFESGNPTAFDIYIGSTKKATVNATSYDGDITQWLLNSENKIPRGAWIDMEIRPNDNAYVVTSVFVQGFVQSRGGGNY